MRPGGESKGIREVKMDEHDSYMLFMCINMS